MELRALRINTHLTRILLGTSILVALLSHTAMAVKYPITLTDCRGKAVTIPREPQRIISTAPSNTEILFALGLDSHIAAVGTWDNYPAAASRKPKIGDYITSIERVLILHPDLVLAHGELNIQAIEGLERHGVRVFALNPKTIDEVQRDILRVGTITNRETQARVVVSRIKSAKEQVLLKTKNIRSKPGVLFSIQADPLWAAGPQTFVDEMIRLAGGTNLAADAKPGYREFSSEAAVRHHPDVIICTDKGGREVYTRGIWKSTNAARNGRVYETNPDYVVRPGPRLAVGILNIARLIHPELFKGK